MLNTDTIKDFQKTILGTTMTSPFELRFKILEMAKQYLDDAYKMQHDMALRNMEYLQDQNKLNVETWKKVMPEKYTMEDILQKAQELYGFVESKDGKNKSNK
tara:strand:+ start:657 stop:962 length:306 start_codon:yes stop_codon:yes gene_type:complete